MRKIDHINIALQDKTLSTSLDEYRMEYNSIPLFGLDDVDTSTTICGYKWQYPFFINAITAGGDECNKINKDFEEVCGEMGIEFFPGSYSPALKNEADKISYPKYRSVNLGLDKNVHQIIEAIDTTNAKYLQLHMNPLQEMIMPEGDRNFETWLKNLQNANEKINIPIILKETGFGTGKSVFELAIKLDKVMAVDVSGKDGTNFAKIENGRSSSPSPYLEEIGYTTAQSLEIAKNYRKNLDIIASGGIRNPLDVIKVLALGAKAAGVSRNFLEILLSSGKEGLKKEIKKWQKEIKYLMILCHAKNIDELYGRIRKIKK